jgi:hypothetical protein
MSQSTSRPDIFSASSWRPYYADPDFTYSIYIDNILNTMSTGYFITSQDDKTNGVGVNLLYGAFYPHQRRMEYTIFLL